MSILVGIGNCRRGPVDSIVTDLYAPQNSVLEIRTVSSSGRTRADAAGGLGSPARKTDSLRRMVIQRVHG